MVPGLNETPSPRKLQRNEPPSSRNGVGIKPGRRPRHRTHTKMGISRQHQRAPYLSRLSSQLFEVRSVSPVTAKGRKNFVVDSTSGTDSPPESGDSQKQNAEKKKKKKEKKKVDENHQGE